MKKSKKFKLQTRFEENKPSSWNKENGYAYIEVQLENGLSYQLIIWTFKYVETARKIDAKNLVKVDSQFLIPPNLLVKELTRECIEKSIEEILDMGDLELILRLNDTSTSEGILF